jgi:ubiquinone/menaquinone biosynthesis C-methylase UbiE
MSIVFDQAVEYYDQTRALPGHIQQWMVDAAQDQIGLVTDARVLEIGVGTGRIALPFARRGYRYTGADLSRPMMHGLRSKAASVPIMLVQSDVAQLPLRSETFDAVLAVHIFHLVSAWQQAMDEAARVLRPGGLLLHGITKRDDDQERDLRRFMQERANALQARHDKRLQWNEINEQLTRRFGAPQEYASPPWDTTHTPRAMIDQFRNRIWSNTWDLRDAVIADVVDTATAWAHEHYGDLDAPVAMMQRFVWQVYQRDDT